MNVTKIKIQFPTGNPGTCEGKQINHFVMHSLWESHDPKRVQALQNVELHFIITVTTLNTSAHERSLHELQGASKVIQL